MTKVDSIIGFKLFSCLLLAVTSNLIDLREVELIDLLITAGQTVTPGAGADTIVDQGTRRKQNE